jgi:hypothetical protein
MIVGTILTVSLIKGPFTHFFWLERKFRLLVGGSFRTEGFLCLLHPLLGVLEQFIRVVCDDRPRHDLIKLLARQNKHSAKTRGDWISRKNIS